MLYRYYPQDLHLSDNPEDNIFYPHSINCTSGLPCRGNDREKISPLKFGSGILVKRVPIIKTTEDGRELCKLSDWCALKPVLIFSLISPARMSLKLSWLKSLTLLFGCPWPVEYVKNPRESPCTDTNARLGILGVE